MDFPINKLPAPKYKDKPAKHKEIKKNPLVKYIDELFNDTYKTNYFKEQKKTHTKKDTKKRDQKKIDSKRTERISQTK